MLMSENKLTKMKGHHLRAYWPEKLKFDREAKGRSLNKRMTP